MSRVFTRKKFWIGFDRHYPEHDPLVDTICLEFLRDFKPGIRIAGGDWMTCEQVSKFPHDEGTETILKEDFRATRQALRRFGITHYLEGNHEERLRRVDVKPSLRSMFNLVSNLQLREMGIKFFPYHPLKGVCKIGHLKVLHGFYVNQYMARKHAEIYGTCVFGHSHRFQTFQPRAAFDKRVGFAIGMTGDLEPTYTKDRAPMGWAQGFAFGYIHRNGWFDLYPVRINRGRVVINGREYGRFTGQSKSK